MLLSNKNVMYTYNSKMKEKCRQNNNKSKNIELEIKS